MTCINCSAQTEETLCSICEDRESQLAPLSHKEERERKALLCRSALEEGLVRTSTEFWLKVGQSGLSPENWVRIAYQTREED